MNIEGKVVAITGASRGIGAVAGRRLASAGAKLVLGGRDQATLAAVASTLGDDGRATHIACDVSRAADLHALVAHARQTFGRLDVLVANAGVASVAPLADGRLDDWDEMIDTNLRGLLHGVAAALPVFLEQGSGQFVAVTSTSAHKWVPGQGVYAATKAAARALCEVLRQEVGPQIRVSMICPGATTTSFGSGGDAEMIARLAAISMDPSAVAEAIAYAIGQPPEVNVGEIVVRSAAQP